MRRAILRFLLSAAILGLALHATESDAAQASRVVHVSGDSVTLGDIFGPAASDTDAVVMRAPRPGEPVTIDAKHLTRLAATHGMTWTPVMADQSIVIERESRIVGSDEVAENIRQALIERGLDENIEINLVGRTPEIHVAAERVSPVSIDSLEYNERSSRFVAVASVEADGKAKKTFRVAGLVHHMEELPVLARRVNAGETITQADVAMREIRRSQINGSVAEQPDQLIGMVARRPVRAEQPVRLGDIEPPMMIKKGGAVTMIYRSPGLLLKALGRAVEDGAQGQAVRVLNLKSKSIVVAVVTGPNTVSVSREAHLVN